jgi:hypothetical protein
MRLSISGLLLHSLNGDPAAHDIHRCMCKQTTLLLLLLLAAPGAELRKVHFAEVRPAGWVHT